MAAQAPKEGKVLYYGVKGEKSEHSDVKAEK